MQLNMSATRITKWLEVYSLQHFTKQSFLTFFKRKLWSCKTYNFCIKNTYFSGTCDIHNFVGTGV